MKGGKYSSNVRNHLNSDMFGSNVNHEQDSQDNVHESRTHNENKLTCDFPSNYTVQSSMLTNDSVHVAMKMI